MNHATTHRLAFAASCALTLLVATGCNNQTEDDDDIIGPESAGKPSSTEAALPDVTIPTQEEADALAAREITAENADEQFEALMREIQNDTVEE